MIPDSRPAMLHTAAGDPAFCPAAPTVAPWQVLVVADAPAVASRMRRALQGLSFQGRAVQLHVADGLPPLQQLLAVHADMAVAVMDLRTDAAGRAAAWVDHIREVMGQRTLRILLRTGQPGGLSARRALAELDINACLDTTAAEDDPALQLAVLAALRSHGEVLALHASVTTLRQQSITDDLTSLYNASHLGPTLERVLSSAQRRGEPVSLVFLDLDDFKLINDAHGHLRGDEVLRQVGRTLLANSRREDCCFRYGGDEFVVVLPNCSLDQVHQHYLPRLLQAFDQLGLNVSHGACDTGPGRYLSGQALLRHADELMYACKREHRSHLARLHRSAIASSMAGGHRA